MKRPPPNSDAEAASAGSKKRRRMSISDDDDGLKLSSSPVYNDTPPMHKIYNSSCRKEKPDELFRKDLITAMKLPDSEQLEESEFWEVIDSWKQEWERGVQVPVNSNNVPNPVVRTIRDKKKSSAFKLPKKFIRITDDDFYSPDHHVMSDTLKKAEEICKYDADPSDLTWLMLYNERRDEWGLNPVSEETLELLLEDFETQCSNRFQDALKTEKGLGIEYDEDVICDVCRSPECEEGNEMVFCDSCNICVHQACYGITAIPEGSWICRPCALNIKPPCILCPNMGGAMKSTRNETPSKNSSGEKWAHVSCALWIPEVSIGCPEKMEPIMRISHVPASRWSLICTLCRERVGACIQCSVKQCKVAYHVTCAFEHGLEMEMKTTPIDSNEEGVKMQSYCLKHSKTDASERNAMPVKSSRRKIKRKKELKSNKESDCKDEVDEHNARLQKIRSLEAQFRRFVNIKDTAELLNIELDIVEHIYNYWVLKRSAKFNKPLLKPKCDEANLLVIKQHENLLYSRLKMFVHLRQDLERVRNLCYMVSRREKIFRSYIRMKSDVLEKQAEILADESLKLTSEEFQEVLSARLGDPLYDSFYCVVFDEKKESDDKTNVSAHKVPNPYAKSYSNNINTRSRRRTVSHGMFEDSTSCDNDHGEMPVLTKCKSEENISCEDKKTKEKITFTHSPFVIKVAPKQENDSDVKPDLTKVEPNISVSSPNGSECIKESVLSENLHSEETKCLESFNGVQESSDNIQKIINSSNETSSDKNSLCLSDKENINALLPMKLKKTRSQTESKHIEFKNAIHELSTQKDLFDEDSRLSMNSDLSIVDDKKTPKRSTRYQMRSRNLNSEDIEMDESSVKSADSIGPPLLLQSQPLCSSSDSVEELTFLPQDRNGIEEKSLDIVTPRRRGRPRKIIRCDNTPDASFTVIKKENGDVEKTDLFSSPCVIDIDKTNSCSDMLELSDSNESVGFRMSLRHNREYVNYEKKPKRKKSVVLKLEHSDSGPLKETNKRTFSDAIDDGICEKSGWNSSEKSLKLNTVEKPSSTRIIIRLRKDPNRESWKNDSSSSSDGNVAFRIVHNDLDVNGEDTVSQFPSIIKDEDSAHNDSENKHRYLMRDRPVPARTQKCNMSRS